MSILEQIMKEYDEAKDDAGFDQGHPIFQMAEHIDSLNRKLQKSRAALLSFKKQYSNSPWIHKQVDEALDGEQEN